MKKPMTFDEFFDEAERLNLVIDVDAFGKALATNLDKMEQEGTIRKHEDGGHEFVDTKEAKE